MPRTLLSPLLAALFMLPLAGSHAHADLTPDDVFMIPPADTVLPGPPLLLPTPNCTQWHEFWPNYCAEGHQESYEDDGDDWMSFCDYITIDGTRYHVEEGVLTYHLQAVAEPGNLAKAARYEISNGDPTGETWYEVYPDYSKGWLIDGWVDNGNGEMDPCDIVVSGGKEWHVNAITPGIVLSLGVPSTGRTATLALIALLALTGLLLVVRARRRAARTGG